MSLIKTRTAVISDGYKIDHNFGEGYTIKIIQVAPDNKETVLFEAETTTNRFVNLNATITDNEIETP